MSHDSRITITSDNIGGTCTWRTLIKRTYEAVDTEIDNLNNLPTTMIYFQNDDLVGIITRLKDASLFAFFNRRIKWIWNEPKSDEVTNISHIHRQLFEFFQIIIELMEFHEKEFGEEALNDLKNRYLMEQ